MDLFASSLFLKGKGIFFNKDFVVLVCYVCNNKLLLFTLSEELINKDKEKYNLTTTTKTKEKPPYPGYSIDKTTNK